MSYIFTSQEYTERMMAKRKQLTSHGPGQKHAGLHGQQGDIERAAAQVNDHHVVHTRFAVQAVRQCGSCRLVDHTEDVQTCKQPCIKRWFLLCCS